MWNSPLLTISSKMTRKDYTHIADVLATVQNHVLKGRLDGEQILPVTAEILADYFERENTRFNRHRFMEAACLS